VSSGPVTWTIGLRQLFVHPQDLNTQNTEDTTYKGTILPDNGLV
jgi:hypothetical protein